MLDKEGFVTINGTSPGKSTPAHSNLDQQVQSCKELERIRMSRKLLTKLSHHYYFDQQVQGCFCRVNISKAKNSWTSQYMVAEIQEVVTHPRYYMVDGVKTNKILKLKHVDQVKEFDFLYISNYEFDEMEYNTWMRKMEE